MADKPIQSWAYRFTVEAVRAQIRDEAAESWTVREVYFDEDGDVVYWSTSPDFPAGDDRAELQKDLNRFFEASLHPAFDIDKREWRPVQTHPSTSPGQVVDE